MCELYGIINYGGKLSGNQMSEIVNALARESEERGSHATGIAYLNRGRLVINKAPRPAHVMSFRIPQGTVSVIGHTRHSTQGSEKYNQNNHPFSGSVGKNRQFALAHNGIIYNDESLRKILKLPKTKIETDSYIAVQLIEYKGNVDMDSLKFMAEQVNGSFSFNVLDHENNHYIVKGDSPISLLHFKKLGVFVYASTDSILYRALVQTALLAHLKAAMNGGDGVECVEMKDGTILRIDKAGAMETADFEFDAYGGLGYSWWDWDIGRGSSKCGSLPPRKNDGGNSSDVEEYLQLLRILANEAGYDPDDVNKLYQDGFTLTEIEELLYDGGLEEDYEDDDFDERQVLMCGI